MMISASEGTQPFNRLWYVDLSQLPQADGALDLAAYDFHKVRLASAWYLLGTVPHVRDKLTPHWLQRLICAAPCLHPSLGPFACL